MRLPDLRIHQVEVVLPGRAIEGFLPTGGDGIAVGTKMPFEALGKTGGIPPQLPDALAAEQPGGWQGGKSR